MFRKKSGDVLAKAIEKIANVKPGEVFGDIEKLFCKISTASPQKTCDMFEAIILILKLNEDPEAEKIILDLASAIARRLGHHARDADLKKKDVFNSTRANKLVESTQKASGGWGLL